MLQDIALLNQMLPLTLFSVIADDVLTQDTQVSFACKAALIRVTRPRPRHRRAHVSPPLCSSPGLSHCFSARLAIDYAETIACTECSALVLAVPGMTYLLSGGTLSPTHSLTSVLFAKLFVQLLHCLRFVQ